MKEFLSLVLKLTIFSFWLISTIIGGNLLNQKVMWQNGLGVLILIASLACVVYYVKKNIGGFIKKVKDTFFVK
jgi:isoprenylcysteine carboxyl methyltransferase (ICMT) family protein YpbQ